MPGQITPPSFLAATRVTVEACSRGFLTSLALSPLRPCPLVLMGPEMRDGFVSIFVSFFFSEACIYTYIYSLNYNYVYPFRYVYINI